MLAYTGTTCLNATVLLLGVVGFQLVNSVIFKSCYVICFQSVLFHLYADYVLYINCQMRI